MEAFNHSLQSRFIRARSGAVGCFILCAVLGLAEGLTLYVLSKFAERYDAVTYSLLVRDAADDSASTRA